MSKDTNTMNNESAAPKKSKLPPFIAVILTLLAVSAALLYLNISSLAKSTAERVATQTLGVAVTIDNMDVAVKSKTITIDGITIANPDGYDAPYAMRVGNITITADQLSRELLSFNQINVSETNIHFAVTKDGTNLTTIRKNISSKSKATAKEPEKAKQPPKVMIKDLLIRDTHLTPHLAVQLDREIAPVLISNINMKNIGTAQNGIMASEATAEIMKHIVRIATEESARQGFLTGVSPEALRQIQQDMDLGKQFIMNIDRAVEKTGKDLRDFGNAVRGMFNQKSGE